MSQMAMKELQLSRQIEQTKYFSEYSTRNIKEIYKFERVLGSGHFGNVYLAHYLKEPTRKYAIKSVNRNKITERSLKRLQNELDVLKTLDHPNIIKYHATFIDLNYIHIVTELCEGGELFYRLEIVGVFSEEEAALCMKQCLLAIKYLHSQGVVHRDLKPENIMFARKTSLEVKIIDFGLSKIHHGESLHSVVGTPYYVSPEILTADYD